MDWAYEMQAGIGGCSLMVMFRYNAEGDPHAVTGRRWGRCLLGQHRPVFSVVLETGDEQRWCRCGRMWASYLTFWEKAGHPLGLRYDLTPAGDAYQRFQRGEVGLL